jgi:ATP-binding cassette subfamily B protein
MAENRNGASAVNGGTQAAGPQGGSNGNGSGAPAAGGTGRGPGRGRVMGPRPKLEHPWRLFGRVMGYVLKRYKFQFVLVLACIVVSVLANLQGTLFTRTLIDSYIMPLLSSNDPDFGPLAGAIGRVALFYAIGVAATYFQNMVMVYVTQGTMRDLRLDIFTHMESLPISYFDTHAHGDIMSIYTNDVDTLRQMVSQTVTQAFNSIFTIVTTLGAMIMLSWPLTILSLVMVGVTLFATAKAAKASGKHFVLQQQRLGGVNGFVQEMMKGLKVVKVFSHEKINQEKFDVLNQELFDSADKAVRYSNALGPLNAQIGNVSYVLCAIVGGALALNGFGGFTLGGLASYLSLNRSFAMPVNQMTTQLNSIVMALAGAQRIFKLLDEEPESDDGYVTLVNAKVDADGQISETSEKTGRWAWKHFHKAEGTTTYVELKGKIVMDHVDFGYVPEKTVLHDITLFAEPGQKIAFVGSTGAGKTTITNLINRFYDIDDGKIRYDDINVNKIRKDDLRRSLGMVLQDTHLFTGTVMDNIRYGKLDATDEEVIEAAKLAGADSFIRQLEDGYQTKLTGDGGNLSQGQRQLLSIARAAIADPPALILDEATSSIDTRTERIVSEGMDALMKGRTTFVIAHRLSTVRNADCIMVLENGRIIERGTHDDLIEQKGKYYQLYTGNQITA